MKKMLRGNPAIYGSGRNEKYGPKGIRIMIISRDSDTTADT
jgi:hypothetical protein